MTSDNRKKILFVKHAGNNAMFVTNDIRILKEFYGLSVKNINTKGNLFIIFTLTKQFLSLLFSILRYDLIYIWFADYHSFLPVLFAKIFQKIRIRAKKKDI